VQKYLIEFTPAAARAYKKLPDDLKVRLGKAIDKLESDPLPNGVRKLSGQEDLFRIRVGDYRIIYQLRATELIILIVRIGHRREVYE
jgi:mRNA interferase RelE/StbE